LANAKDLLSLVVLSCAIHSFSAAPAPEPPMCPDALLACPAQSLDADVASTGAKRSAALTEAKLSAGSTGAKAGTTEDKLSAGSTGAKAGTTEDKLSAGTTGAKAGTTEDKLSAGTTGAKSAEDQPKTCQKDQDCGQSQHCCPSICCPPTCTTETRRNVCKNPISGQSLK